MTRRKDTGIAALQTGTEGKKSKIGKSEDEVDGGKKIGEYQPFGGESQD